VYPFAVADSLDELRGPTSAWWFSTEEVLDGSLSAGGAALTGLSAELIEQLGGTGDWDGP
jgi:hypothetical protein